jgi:hypothetical protein
MNQFDQEIVKKALKAAWKYTSRCSPGSGHANCAHFIDDDSVTVQYDGVTCSVECVDSLSLSDARDSLSLLIVELVHVWDPTLYREYQPEDAAVLSTTLSAIIASRDHLSARIAETTTTRGHWYTESTNYRDSGRPRGKW